MDAFRIGVIFDCDGTLIDSMMVWRETEAGLARRANVTLTAAEIDALTAMTIPAARSSTSASAWVRRVTRWSP